MEDSVPGTSSCRAIVVPGEAPETDEEEFEEAVELPSNSKLAGPSSSKSSYFLSGRKGVAKVPTRSISEFHITPQKAKKSAGGSIFKPLKYDSPQHRKLREANVRLFKDSTELVRRHYGQWEKQVAQTTQAVISTQV
jgi:hypothetical protein